MCLLVVGAAGGPLGLVRPAAAQGVGSYDAAREQMVREEIIGAGIKNERVIEAIRRTPRHEFVLQRDRPYAYYDMALPIGEGQTISPPFIVAYMTEQLDPQPTDKVLEIGTGSGYQAAVLSPLVKAVYSIEIVEPLGRKATQTLRRLGYQNVLTKTGDGYQGWAEHAPFDKIIVTCSPEKVPEPLIEQLREGGRIIVPLGERYQQTFHLLTKRDGKLVDEALRPTLFVPMTGQAEKAREKDPEPAQPGLANGGFEETYREGDEEVIRGWHYARQVKIVPDRLAREGEHYALFTNREPGRGSQVLQGFSVDGTKVRELDLSLWVRGQEIRPGQRPEELPMLVITFYDDGRDVVGERGLGPWRGTFEWQQPRARVSVPPRARFGIVRLGLLGATGELAADGVSIQPVGR
jgi:protein-L-isoaspartate(D-aspartate) O-methyltransferase